ncbi:MAG: three-Cys-motif partner protein TcmP [Opitutaceae bacterium]
MATSRFHKEPYDAGTLTKLKIFELYSQEWIPVFTSRADPVFSEVHIFDFFSGPGTDSKGVYGSPLRILDQLRRYQRQGMAGWSRVQIVAHLFDEQKDKIDILKQTLAEANWKIPGVTIDLQAIEFKVALKLHRPILENARAAKLLIIDQFGVDEVTDDVFKELIKLPTTDFIFFLSSSTLHRFRDHPAIKMKIDKPEDSYDVHRAASDYFRALAPPHVFLGRFSIRKRSNIYGLLFGSQHPLGIHKFLRVAWDNDEIAGEANFVIERENIAPGELMLPMEELRPNKIREFEADLEAAIRAGRMKSEADLIHFSIGAGMTCPHCTPVLQKLKRERVIECDFRTPDVGKFRKPRPLHLA